MDNKETKFCHHCGAEIDTDATTCPTCGLLQHGKQVSGQTKNPGIAAILSFFVAGLGQIYNGQIGKGILLIVLQIVNVCLMVVLIGFVTYLITWAYGVWDAYTTAERINAESV